MLPSSKGCVSLGYNSFKVMMRFQDPLGVQTCSVRIMVQSDRFSICTYGFDSRTEYILSHRLTVRTAGFQPVNRGSIRLGRTDAGVAD